MLNDELTAFVLHKRPYRETSFLVDIFTLEKGRLSMVAKGVRKNKGANKSILQPFTPLTLELVGKSELKNMKRIEACGKAVELKQVALFSAMYVNELLQRLLPLELGFPTLFSAYRTLLEQLAGNLPVEPLLREFEWQLLSELGFGVDLQLDESGNAIDEGVHYQILAESGLRRALKPHSNSISGAELLMLHNSDWNPQSLRAAKKLTRILLNPLLGDKPLNSRQLFKTL